MRTKNALVALVISIVVIAGVSGYYYYYVLPHTPSKTTSVTPPSVTAVENYSVFLTDPPTVPQGTQAIYINVSAVAIHLTNGSWLYSTVSEELNLMQLVNISKAIAVFSIPKNSTVTQVRLYISNATIEVGGQNYPLFIPSGVIKIPVTNATASLGALVDLQAHVVEAYVGGQPTYILTPVVAAVPFNESQPVGSTVPVPKHLMRLLNESRADLVIESAVIKVSGNQTFINITIKNEGSEPAMIYGVTVNGTWDIAGSVILSIPNGFVKLRLGAEVPMPMFFAVNGTQLVQFPVVFKPFGLRPVSQLSPSFAPQFSNFSALSWNFTQPFHREHGLAVLGYEGYTLEPGQTVSLVFSGTINLPHASFIASHSRMRMHIYIVPLAGQSYWFRVLSAPKSNATITVSAI